MRIPLTALLAGSACLPIIAQVNPNQQTITLNTDRSNPNQQKGINRKSIVSMAPSKASPMPAAVLINVPSDDTGLPVHDLDVAREDVLNPAVGGLDDRGAGERIKELAGDVDERRGGVTTCKHGGLQGVIKGARLRPH